MLTGLGVLCLTPDSLLVRLIETDEWTLLFWRGLLMSLGLSLFSATRKEWVSGLRGLGARGLLAGLFLASSTTCFVLSLQRTAVANTLVIIASAPLIAAALSRVFLNEAVERRTLWAILAGMSGVMVTVSGSLGGGSYGGDLFALGSAISMAAHHTALRSAPEVSGPASVCAAGFMAAMVAWPWARPLAIEGSDLVWIPLLGLVVLPLAFGLMAVGPSYLPAAEVSLFLLAETALGPLWVWLVLGEVPAGLTLLGGAIVVGTLLLHTLGMRSKSPAPT